MPQCKNKLMLLVLNQPAFHFVVSNLVSLQYFISQVCTESLERDEGVVANFLAHSGEDCKIAALAFDPRYTYYVHPHHLLSAQIILCHKVGCCLWPHVHLDTPFMSSEFSLIHCFHPKRQYTTYILCTEGIHKERYMRMP